MSQPAFQNRPTYIKLEPDFTISPSKPLMIFNAHRTFQTFYCNLSPTKDILIHLPSYQEKNMRVNISTIFHTRCTARVLVSGLDNILLKHHQQI